MVEPEHLASDLPELDRTGDPRGSAVAWALLAVGTALVAGLLLTMTGVARVW
jgi:hypothetical protein